MISANIFFDNFKKEYKKSPTPSGIRPWSFWTKSTLRLLRKMGEGMGYNVLTEKPVRFDMTWFNPKYLEAQVTIEYETREKSVLASEVRNLACASAKLKVLITYVKEGTQQKLLDEILSEWDRRSRRIWDDEFLVMFIIFHHEKGHRIFDIYEGHRIKHQKDGLRLRHLGAIPMYL